MNINTKRKTIRLTKSEADRLREASYIVGNLVDVTKMLDLETPEMRQVMLTCCETLAMTADHFGAKEPIIDAVKH